MPVEKIAVGDEVVARNRATGKLETQPVTALTTPHHDKLLEVRVEGEHDPLRPSTGHPFWVKRGEAQGAWIPAGEMRVGDRLQTIGGQWRMITAINPVAGDQTVYNFTVANYHDYFVGETGFLVHNAPPCGCKCGQEGHHIVPENFLGFGPAKGVLSRAGLGIDDLANLLPLDYYYHRRLHTYKYRDWINETLTDAEGKQPISCVLKSIGASILGGTANF